MPKQAPTLGKLATMVVFALSCFGLLLFLWKSFGGPIPLAPQGYSFRADFDEATQLADNANVRISGVNVGRVVESEPLEGHTRVKIELDSKYAPIPRDTKAILRLKTLLGETYVELTPGTTGSGRLPDGALLPRSQIGKTVELDEILRAFDPQTRRDARKFLQGFAGTLEGNGENLNDTFGSAAPFAEDTEQLVTTLNGQEPAIKRLIRDTGLTFDALGGRQGQVSGLVRSAGTVLATTARRNAELAETVRILPTTLRELRPTLAELRGFAVDARPTVRELRPAAGQLAPALRDAGALAPDLQGLFRGVDKLATVSKTALPAATKTIDSAHELFRTLETPLRDTVPILDYLGLYKDELVAAFAGLASATNGAERLVPGGPPVHYLRALVPVSDEALIAAQDRLPDNRRNPYLAPRGLDNLTKGGIESLDCSGASDSLLNVPCRQQKPLDFRGRSLIYPHVTRDP